MGDAVAFCMAMTLIASVAFFGFERMMPDFGQRPMIGNISLGAGVFVLVFILSSKHPQDWIIAIPFLLAGAIVNALSGAFPRWSQTPEGKLRFEAERENYDRDTMRRLAAKYHPSGGPSEPPMGEG